MQILLIPQNKSLMEEYTWLFRENAYFLPWYARLLVIWAPLTFILLSCYISFFWVPISVILWHSGCLSSLFSTPSLCTLPLLPKVVFFFCLHPPFLFCLLLMSAHFLGLDLDMICVCQSSISLHSSPCILYNSYLRCITIVYLYIKFTRINLLGIETVFYSLLYHKYIS